jgi:hypothetical protein
MLQYLGPALTLFISGTIIYYLQHLEKIGCKCSLTFQRNYIFYYTIVLFSINLLTICFQDRLKNLALFILPFTIFMLIAGIINIVYTIEYVEAMKKQNCKCSDSLIRDLMFIIAILQICVWIIVFLIMISIFVFKKNLPTSILKHYRKSIVKNK